MEHRSLLNVLSPQLQALVEASLGEKLQIKQNASTIAQVSMTTDAIVEQKPSETMIASDSKVVKLNPSELFGKMPHVYLSCVYVVRAFYCSASPTYFSWLYC